MRVEEVITDRIVKLLEAGTAPWHRPWSVRGRRTRERNFQAALIDLPGALD